MKYYKFKDLDSDIEGIVVNFLNPILGVGNEVVDMVVKYRCPKENQILNRFRNFDEVELTEIKENEYLKLL